MHVPASVLSMVATIATALPVTASDAGAVWQLVDLDGQAVSVTVTLDLSAPGQMSGKAPCNRYSGRYDGTLPDFRPGPLRATKMACDALALEGAFFRALRAVTRAEAAGDALVLTGDGVRMAFVRAGE